mmetsp:Transcript_9565/g.14831  ORF Transcript_9565/g.14831 Transcript_9565/m.14831 type:complete len:98 (+) Transcript_9565:231-524(+)
MELPTPFTSLNLLDFTDPQISLESAGAQILKGMVSHQTWADPSFSSKDGDGSGYVLLILGRGSNQIWFLPLFLEICVLKSVSSDPGRLSESVLVCGE